MNGPVSSTSSTLREESTQLVSKRTLQRRHPDMIWSVDTLDGRKVVFLMEFQRTVEPLMALRTTTYTALTLEGIQQGARQGRHEGQVLLLRRQIARKFGDTTAGQLSELLDDLTGLDNIDRLTDALIECGTGEEFLERVRTA